MQTGRMQAGRRSKCIGGSAAGGYSVPTMQRATPGILTMPSSS
jgi:hypothetical protein